MTRARLIRTIGLMAALIALVAALPAPAGAARRVDPAPPTELVDVIVVLRHQEDLSTVRGRRKARLVAVVKALRARADLDQVAIRALLFRGRTQGKVTTVEPLWILNAIHVVATPDIIAQVGARPEVAEIRPNAEIAAPAGAPAGAPEPNIGLVGAPAMWSRGFTGQGVVVANMDTGVDASHADLVGRWRGGSNSWYDPNGEHPTVPTDVNGHGTWTMGVMVGGDAGGTALGVAPDARWIAVKMFNDRGAATTARIHSSFQWLLDPDGNPATADAPDVVNDSWTLTNTGCSLEFQLDLRGLRAAGILPVFAAGNGGPGSGTSLSPANNPEAFAVGNTDNADLIDPSSSRGPSSCGQPTYPQLVAPGVDVRTTDLYGYYTTASGTSLAAPHVAGALALLLSAYPDLNPDRQESALESAAVDLGAVGADNTYGFGRLDSLASFNWVATAPDFTAAATPSAATTAAGGSVAYGVTIAPVNGFAGDVALTAAGLPSGATASFSPATVPGGSGSSQLTVTTSSSLAPGTYPLTIRATSGGLTRSAYVSLIVSGPPDFALSASPASATVTGGQTASYQVSVTSKYGFAGNVSLTAAGLPSGATATFSPNPRPAPGAATLTIRTRPTPRGTFTVRITGQSGALTHQVTATLVVR